MPDSAIRVAGRRRPRRCPRAMSGTSRCAATTSRAGYYRDSGSECRGVHRGRLAAHRRPRPDRRGRAVGDRPRQGDHLRQRPELLSARHRSDRAAGARPGTRQGRRRRLPPAGRGDGRADALRPAPRCAWRISCRWPREVTRLVNEHAGLEVAQVVPVKRIPKTTSGKIQRVALEQAYVAGEFAAEMAELARLRDAAHPHADDRDRHAGDGASRPSSTTRCRASVSRWTTTCSRSARAR